MKVVFVVASPRDSMCGVADYTTRLAAAFEGSGVDAVVEYLDGFSVSALRALKQKYGGSEDTVYHLQYPSLHMGKSLSPALMPFLFPNLFVTLHEFRIFSLPRKLIFLPHALSARGIIFSNQAERDIFAGYFPFSGRKLSVIPIGNNIVRLAERDEEKATPRLIYFGQISRDKGIETFVETVLELKETGTNINAAMIGALVEGHSEIVEMVRTAEQQYGVKLILSQPSDVVSRELAASDFALLPFPGGVTDKRGSALACLDHGVTLLTTHGDETPEWFRQVSYPVTGAHEASSTISRILTGELPRSPAPDILEREMKARNWPEIARAHITLYRQ